MSSQAELHEAYMKLLVLEIKRNVESTAVPLEALYHELERGTLMDAFMVWHNDAPSKNDFDKVRSIETLIPSSRDDHMAKLLYWCSHAQQIEYVPTEEELDDVISLLNQIDFNITLVKRLYWSVATDKADVDGKIGKMNHLVQLVQERNSKTIGVVDYHMTNAFGDPTKPKDSRMKV